MKTKFEQIAEQLASMNEVELERFASFFHRRNEDVAVDLMRNISLADMTVMVGQGNHIIDNDTWDNVPI
jgi:hypothetical protein